MDDDDGVGQNPEKIDSVDFAVFATSAASDSLKPAIIAFIERGSG